MRFIRSGLKRMRRISKEIFNLTNPLRNKKKALEVPSFIVMRRDFWKCCYCLYKFVLKCISLDSSKRNAKNHRELDNLYSIFIELNNQGGFTVGNELEGCNR